MFEWLFGNKEAPQLSVGGWDADIPIFPPFMAFGLAIIAILTHYFIPITLLPQQNKLMKSLAFRGSVLSAAAASVYFVIENGSNELAAAGSGVAFTPVGGLATTGLYAMTRNPLYFSLVFIGVPGLACAIDSSWPLFLTATLLYTYLNAWVIPAEEALLAKEFGSNYEAYCNEVPRWF